MDARNSLQERLSRPLRVGVSLLVGSIIVTTWLGATRRGLEYDEIWTLREYAHAPSIGRIFSDMALANNHSLNSLLVRLTTSLLGDTELAVRLPALIAGTVLFVCVPFVVYRLTRRWEVSLLATAWITTSAPLMYFAQASRGYALQTLLVFAYTALVLEAHREPGREGRMLAAAAVVGAAAMLVVPTTVLFLLPVAVVDVATRAMRWRKGSRKQRGYFLASEGRAFVAYAALALWCAAWILHGSTELAESRAFAGIEILSVSQWVLFCGDVIRALGLRPEVILTVVGLLLCVTDGTTWTLSTTAFCPLLFAWFSRAGPPRTYVPMVPLVCMAAAMGLCRALDLVGEKIGRQVRSGIVIAAAALPLLVLPGALRSWMPLDWKHAIDAVRESAGSKACIVYPTYDGYVLTYYYAPEILLDSFHRLPGDSGSVLVLTEPGGRMTGVDVASGRTMTIFCPERLRASVKPAGKTTVELASYTISSLPREFSPQSIDPRSVYLLQLGPADRNPALRRLENLYVESGRDQWQLVNPHIELVVNQSGKIVQAFLLATTNVDTFVREWTNAVSRGAVPASFHQLVSPKTGN
ncbi:MAG: glycosyltransferase family 39 protein [Verrucomicrobiia bacterium]